jgi:hypothetical protein
LFYSYVRNNVNKSEKDTHSSEEQLNWRNWYTTFNYTTKQNFQSSFHIIL